MKNFELEFTIKLTIDLPEKHSIDPYLKMILIAGQIAPQIRSGEVKDYIEKVGDAIERSKMSDSIKKILLSELARVYDQKYQLSLRINNVKF